MSLDGVSCQTLSGYDGAEGTSKFEIAIVLTENRAEGTLVGDLEFNSELFERGTAEAIAHTFETLCAVAGKAAADMKAQSVPMVDATGTRMLLEEWSGAKSAWADSHVVPQLLHELFEAQVAATPDAIALSFAEEGGASEKCPRWTYSEVDALAEEVAESLMRLGVGPDVVVGVCTGHKPEYIWTILGILKAGGAFMPIGTSIPSARVVELLRRAQCTVVVYSRDSTNPALIPGGCGTSETGSATVVSAIGATVLMCPATSTAGNMPECLKRSGERRSSRQKNKQKAKRQESMSLAYVMATSGSTGIPDRKSVV